jgi:hypothetical protein
VNNHKNTDRQPNEKQHEKMEAGFIKSIITQSSNQCMGGYVEGLMSLRTELGFNGIDNIISYLEGFSQYVVRNRWC